MMVAQKGKLVKRENSNEILRETKAYVGENPVRNARRDKFSYKLMGSSIPKLNIILKAG